MTARWFVAKYIGDLRRREPTNIGVMLFVPGNVLYRFRGQRISGEIDGRRARFSRSPETYKAWVRYWQHAAAQASEDVPEGLLAHDPDQNYVLEFGGERLFGNEDLDAEGLLESLYGTLVEEEPERETLSVTQLSEAVFTDLNIAEEVQRDFRLELPVTDQIMDSVLFDYRYDNGRPNLMRAVTLTYSDNRSWDNLHSASWDLQQARAYPVDENQQMVTLVKARPADAALERQLALLGRAADALVDLGQDTAPDQLTTALGL